MHYQNLEEDILVKVDPFLEVSQSSIEHSYYFYTYKVSITNLRKSPIQLQSRFWRIKNGQGKEEVVEGNGVLGQNPTLKPGETYEYTSYCPLRTRTGNMRGYYTFKDNDADIIKANIPLFFLRPKKEELDDLQ